jgi:hypothetical protein
MSAAKSFDKYWVSTGCRYPKNDVSDRGIAHRAWDAALKSAEALKPSYNNARAEICANVLESDCVCNYCVDNMTCLGVKMQNFPQCFEGRKLSPVA